MDRIHWITTALARHFPGADPEQGVDLNRNGKIEETERLHDFNKDQKIDAQDWRRFLEVNQASFDRLDGTFHSYFAAGRAFKADNEIHDILTIEARFDGVTPAQTRAAYATAADVLATVRQRAAHDPKLTPQQKLRLVYDVMREKKLRIGLNDNALFTHAVGKRLFDCDTSSDIVLAVAHEMGWPVFLVNVPGHVFVRWDDGAARFNMDFGLGGQVQPDQWYQQQFSPDATSVRNGFFLGNHTRASLLSSMYHNVGLAHQTAGQKDKAIGDFKAALQLNPLNHISGFCLAEIYRSQNRLQEARSVVDSGLALVPDSAGLMGVSANLRNLAGDLQGALKDANAAIAADPRNDYACAIRAVLKFQLQDLSGAALDADKAVQLYEARGQLITGAYALPYLVRGLARKWQENYAGALEDLQKALAIEPQSGLALTQIAWVKIRMKDFPGALEALNHALQLEPNRTSLYLDRSEILREQKRFDEALADIDKAAALEPGSSDCPAKRGDIYKAMGRKDDALKEYDKAIALDPGNQWHYMRRGMLHLDMQHLKAGISDLEAAIRIDPSAEQYVGEMLRLTRSIFGITGGNLAGVTTSYKQQLAELQKQNEEWRRKTRELNRRIRLQVMTPNPLSLSGGYRIPVHQDRKADGRVELQATWRSLNMNGWFVEPQLQMGYATQGDYHLLGLSGGLALVWRRNNLDLFGQTNIGYDFRLSGDETTAPVRSGATLRYGVGGWCRFGKLAIGTSVNMQHEMRDFSKAAVVPGISLGYAAW